MDFVEMFIVLRDFGWNWFNGVIEFATTPQAIFAGGNLFDCLIYLGPAVLITTLLVRVVGKATFLK